LIVKSEYFLKLGSNPCGVVIFWALVVTFLP
jgi:hypothetical protein